MNPATEPARPGAAGFVPAVLTAYTLTWHHDPACTLLGVRQITRCASAPTLVDVALAEAGHGRLPCLRCAYAALLDDLAA